MRTLLMLRHADAESTRPGSRDRERRLTPAGARAAADLGGALREAGVRVDLALCSVATRAQQTLAELDLAATHHRPRIGVLPELYDAGGEEILDLIRRTEDDVTTLLVVGHAPGLPWVVGALADPATSDPGALVVVASRYPAGALATLELDGAWTRLTSARLSALRLPRGR